jgi:tetratricopeptide (TPR) repeat protein
MLYSIIRTNPALRSGAARGARPAPGWARLCLRALALASLLSVAAACALLQRPPERTSTAQERVTRQVIRDPVRFQKAQSLVNEGNRLLMQNDLAGALRKADQSLAEHETFEGYYLKATALYQQNKKDEALTNYLEAEKLNSGDPQLLMTLGTVYSATGAVDKAQERYLRLVELYPEDPVYWYKAGITYKILRQYDKAYEYLKKADVAGFRFLDQVYVQLGDVCLELRRYDESKAYFEKAKNLNPELKDAERGGAASEIARLLDEGNVSLRENRYEEALAKFRAAAQRAPDQASPLLLSGSTLIALERYEEASKDLTRAVELNPRDPRGYSLLGSAYHKLSRYREALAIFEKGVQVAPENYEIYNKIGLVYRDREEVRRAIDSFYRALAIDSNYVPARKNLAYALLEDRRYVDARREFEAAARLAPGDAELGKGAQLVEIYMMLDRGDRFFQDNRIPQAIAEYQKALAVRTDIPLVFNSLGQAEFARRGYAEAARHYNKALELDANNVGALQGLLRVHGATRNTREQNKVLDRLKALTRNNLAAAIALGRLKEDENKLAEAERYYQDLLRANPEGEALRYRLGFVYYKMGLEHNRAERYREALARFEKAQEFNPEIPQLPDALSTVRENIRFAALLPKLKQAEAHFARNEYDSALPLYEAVYRELKRPLILVKISQCYIAMGQERKALQLLENAESDGANGRAVEISEAMFNYVLQKGEVDRAERGFREITESHPDAYYSWYKLGVIELMKRRFSSAIENFNRAIVYKPDFSPAYIARGVALYETGERDRAKNEFEEALKRDEAATLASFNLGVYYYNANLLDQAKKIFLELAGEMPGFTDPRFQLSYIYFQQGQLDDAEREMRACLEIRQEDRFYWALAQIREKRYANSRNPADAETYRNALNELLTRFPSSTYAQDARAKLAALRPGERIVQPYAFAAAASQPSLINRDLIIREGATLAAYDSGGRRRRWAVRFDAPPRSVFIDVVLHALTPGRVALYDLADGGELSSFAVPAETVQIFGSYDRIGALTRTPARRGQAARSELLLYDSVGRLRARRTAAAGADFRAAGGALVQLEARAGKLKLTRLNEDLSAGAVLELPWERSGRLPETRTEGELLVLTAPGAQAAVVQATRLELLGRITLARGVNSVKVNSIGDEPTLAAVFDAELRVFAANGRLLRKVSLPTAAASSDAFRLAADGGLVFLGRDRLIYALDESGRKLWSTPLPAAARTPAGSEIQSAFTIFY